MLQLLAHLIGDYLLQSHDMATKKTKSSKWALYHAITYTIPFLFLTTNLVGLSIICLSHFLIDRFRLARYLIIAKNTIFGLSDNTNNTPTGYPEGTPDWLAVWLLIIADNTLHLLINYLVLEYV